MNPLLHTSAKASHYDTSAEHYDAFNEENSKIINQFIEKTLQKYNVKTVLDLTCGTGSQVFWLAKRGYDVVGSDINAKMLSIAKEKAQKEALDIPFLKGDMRTAKVGTFDAVITIFNSVGHLTKSDFEKTMRNIHRNLNEGGIYIFDIFNLSYLMKDNNITKLTIDWQTITDNAKIREIQYSTIDKNGTLASYTIDHVQTASDKPKISKSSQTLQVYTAKQLKEMLQRNGFKVLRQCGIDGSRFIENKTERIMTIAKKATL
jgi:ubiquinone/menaquinone biosynthesis C-methylase UbiE